MHHSLKIRILDLDYIESTLEQDIMDVEAEKIVGGKFVKEEIIVKPIITREKVQIIIKEKLCADDDYYCLMNVDPMLDPGSLSMITSTINDISSKSLLTKTSVNA